MSRGPGRIQRAIYALIAGDEHGAWLVSDICKHEYSQIDRIEKKHQVAVNRALSSMTLPEPWEAGYSGSRGNMRVLYNARDAESRARADWLTKYDCSWEAYKERHWRIGAEPEIEEIIHDAAPPSGPDELSRLEQRIQRTETNIAFLESAGDHSAIRHWSDELRSLEKHRSKLIALSRHK